MITITPQAIEKFLADSKRYLAQEEPRFTRVAGPLPPAAPRPRQPAGPSQSRWEARSTL
jgi:hypothetical protein